MQGILWILIDGRKSEVNAVLAGEALRRASLVGGEKSEIMIIGPEGPRAPFAGSPSPGDRLLVLGEAEPPMLWNGLPRVASTVKAALEDANGLLRVACQPAAGETNFIRKAFAYISGRFKASH